MNLKVVGPTGKVIPPPGEKQNPSEPGVVVPIVPQAQVIAQIEKVGDQIGIKGLIPMNQAELALALLKLGTVMFEQLITTDRSPIIKP